MVFTDSKFSSNNSSSVVSTLNFSLINSISSKKPIESNIPSSNRWVSSLNFFEFEVHVGVGEGVYPEVASPLETLHMVRKRDSQAPGAEPAAPGAEDVFQMVWPVEVEAQVPQIFFLGGFLEIIRRIDDQVSPLGVFLQPGYTSQSIEPGPDDIHGNDDLPINQFIEQIIELSALNLCCFPHIQLTSI